MSMNILRATKLKYGAIHSAEPKQMWLWALMTISFRTHNIQQLKEILVRRIN